MKKNQHPARLFLLVIIGLMVFMLLSMGPSNNSATMKAEATRQAIIEETEKNSPQIFAERYNDEFETHVGRWIVSSYISYLDSEALEGRRSFFKDTHYLYTSSLQVIDRVLNDYLGENNGDSLNDFNLIGYYVVDTTDDKTDHHITNSQKYKEYVSKDTSITKKDNTWFIVIQFDKDGKLKVTKSYNNTRSLVIQNSYEEQLHEILTSISNNDDTLANLEVNDIKNMTFAFIVTEDMGLVSTDPVYDESAVHLVYHDEMLNSQNMYFTMSMFILIAFVAFYPHKRIKETKFYRTLMSLPIELMAFSLMIVLILIYTHTLSLGGDAASALGAFFIFPIAYLLTMHLIFFFKEVSTMGLKNAYLQYSLIHNDMKEIKKILIEVYHYLANDNLEPTDKGLLRIIFLILLNLLLIVLFNSLGLFFYIPYIICLFLIIFRKNQRRIEDFLKVKELTTNISNGDFEEAVEKDNLGVYEPLKGDLINIQQGIEEAVEKAMVSQRMKNELITNVSHDLKTPLTAIISYIDLLKNENITEEERKNYLEILEKSADRLKHLIEDLFEMSKANSGSITLDYMDVDLISLLKQVEMECQNAFNEKHLIIKHHFSDEKVLLPLDPQKPCRIFENLLSNVGKYALDQTRVFISVTDFESRVDVEIKNVSKEEIDYTPDEIVERFTRGDKSRNSEGSGLGLAIAKSFTELMKGRMHIDLDGDIFKVTISFYKNNNA